MAEPTSSTLRLRLRLGVRHGQTGSATVEYVGALALLGLLVLALALPVAAAGTSLATKVCQIYTAVAAVGGGAGGGTCGGPAAQQPQAPVEPPFDPKPVRCKVGDHGEKLSAEFTVLVFKFGENAGLLQTRYSNGTVSYTATNGGQLGVVVSAPGAEVKAGGAEAGEKVDLGGDFKVDAGSTWNFANQADADAMREQLDAYRWDQTLQVNSPAYKLWTLVHGGKKPPRPPDQTVVMTDFGGYLEGKAGISVPGQKGPTVPGPPIPGTGVTVPTPPQVGIKFAYDSKWSRITDTTKETKTWTTTGEGYGQISGSAGPVKGEYKGLLGSSMSFTRDKDNQLTNVTLVSTVENKATASVSGGNDSDGGKGTLSAGGSGVHVTTASLNLRTPEQRALAEAWLERQQTDPLALVSPETAFPRTLVPGDAFQNLMFTGATVSDVNYDSVTDKAGFAAKIKAGVSIGIDLSRETSDSRATDASYLGAPSDGASARPSVPFPDCTSR